MAGSTMDRDSVVHWDVRREMWCRRRSHVTGEELLEYVDGSHDVRPRAAVERDIATGRLVPNPNADPPFDGSPRRH
jgi:hypothetical protein